MDRTIVLESTIQKFKDIVKCEICSGLWRKWQVVTFNINNSTKHLCMTCQNISVNLIWEKLEDVIRTKEKEKTSTHH